LQIETLPETELGPNFRIPAEESEEENAQDAEAKPLQKKRKAPCTPSSSKARPQGGTSTTALEKKKKKKKKREAIANSSDDEEGGALRKVPITKK
jgi:hypothetical protein